MTTVLSLAGPTDWAGRETPQGHGAYSKADNV